MISTRKQNTIFWFKVYTLLRTIFTVCKNLKSLIVLKDTHFKAKYRLHILWRWQKERPLCIFLQVCDDVWTFITIFAMYRMHNISYCRICTECIKSSVLLLSEICRYFKCQPWVYTCTDMKFKYLAPYAAAACSIHIFLVCKSESLKVPYRSPTRI